MLHYNHRQDLTSSVSHLLQINSDIDEPITYHAILGRPDDGQSVVTFFHGRAARTPSVLAILKYPWIAIWFSAGENTVAGVYFCSPVVFFSYLIRRYECVDYEFHRIYASAIFVRAENLVLIIGAEDVHAHKVFRIIVKGKAESIDVVSIHRASAYSGWDSLGRWWNLYERQACELQIAGDELLSGADPACLVYASHLCLHPGSAWDTHRVKANRDELCPCH